MQYAPRYLFGYLILPTYLLSFSEVIFYCSALTNSITFVPTYDEVVCSKSKVVKGRTKTADFIRFPSLISHTYRGDGL